MNVRRVARFTVILLNAAMVASLFAQDQKVNSTIRLRKLHCKAGRRRSELCSPKLLIACSFRFLTLS
jgi:hypothetical protein